MKKIISLLLFFLINQTIIPQSWVELNSPFNSVVRVLHVSNSNILFAGGDSGFFSTNDEGATWDTVLTQNIRSIYLHNDSTWYLCTYGGIYKTTDSGEQWSPFGQQFSTNQVTDIAINRNDNSIFASTTSDLYKSIDDGVSWDVIRTTNHTSKLKIQCVGDTIIFIGGKIHREGPNRDCIDQLIMVLLG